MNSSNRSFLSKAPRAALVLRAIAGSLVACVLLGSVASAAPYSVAGSPPAPADSELTIDWGNSAAGNIGTTGALTVSGAADATVSVSSDAASPWMSGSGNGSFDFNSASIALPNFGLQTLNFGAFGTVDVTFTDVKMSITSTGGIPVVNNEWSLDSIGTPSTMSMVLNSGTILLSNPTGLFGAFTAPGSFPTLVDLSVTPSTLGTLGDLTGLGIGGTADSQSISLDIPGGPGLVVNSFAETAAGTPSFVLNGWIHGGVYLAVVPEPGSVALLGLGSLALALCGMRRSRNRR